MTVEYRLPDPGEPDSIVEAFTALDRATTRLGEDVPLRLDDDDTPDTAVQLLASLRAARQALASLEAFVEAATAHRLRYGRNEVAGWVAEVRGGKDRKTWEHYRLAFAVCRDLAVDPDTGEIVPEVSQIIDQVRSRLLNCAAVSYWRATQLRPLGIDPDEFCRSTPARRTVRLTPLADEDVTA